MTFYRFDMTINDSGAKVRVAEIVEAETEKDAEYLVDTTCYWLDTVPLGQGKVNGPARQIVLKAAKSKQLVMGF